MTESRFAKTKRAAFSLFLAACIPFIQCHNVFRAVLASWQAANREHVTAVNEVRTATQELHNLQKQVREACSVFSRTWFSIEESQIYLSAGVSAL
jgi:hypothetical protein